MIRFIVVSMFVERFRFDDCSTPQTCNIRSKNELMAFFDASFEILQTEYSAEEIGVRATVGKLHNYIVCETV